jgi:nucleoside-diphosphate-sugar epimerase
LRGEIQLTGFHAKASVSTTSAKSAGTPLKNILVIGGSGFVGKALIPTLSNADNKVSVLNRGTHRVEGASQLIGDRNDYQDIARHAGAFDVVIDTSGYTRQQVETAFSVFGSSAGKWIHLSSAAVYRETLDHLPSEIDVLGGAEIWGEYGVDKSEADEFLIGQSECPIAILRPPYLYGPNNANDRETFVWSRVLTERPIVVPGDGSAQFQFLHVQDLANIIAHLVDTDFGAHAIYNIAEPETMNAEQWVIRVAAAAGVEADIISGETRAAGVAPRKYFPFRDNTCALDVSRFVRDFDWAFQFSFDQGIKRTFASYDRAILPQFSLSTSEELCILGN